MTVCKSMGRDSLLHCHEVEGDLDSNRGRRPEECLCVEGGLGEPVLGRQALLTGYVISSSGRETGSATAWAHTASE